MLCIFESPGKELIEVSNLFFLVVCTNEFFKSFSYPKNNINKKEKGSPIQVLPHHIERV